MKVPLLAMCLVFAAAVGDELLPGAGFPEVAFDELTEEELLRFLAVFPEVQDAMEESGFEPEMAGVASADEAIAAVVRAVDGIGDVEGVAAILEAASIEWVDFRATTLKVVAVVAATGGEFPLSEREWSTDKHGKNDFVPFSSRVPASNIELVRDHADELDVHLD